MDFAPACAESIGNCDDFFICFRVILLEKAFDHALQKAVMLAERLDQAIRLRQRPCACDALLCLIHTPEAHQVHDDHEMQINRSHGIQLRIHGQRQLRNGQRTIVVFLQIRLMGQHIACPQFQAVRQMANILLKINIIGHGQVQQHRGCRNRKHADGMKLRRGFRPEVLLQIRLQPFKGLHSQMGVPSGEVGKESHKVG